MATGPTTAPSTSPGRATTVTFNGSGTQTIGGTAATNFRNLTINKSNGSVELDIDTTVGLSGAGTGTLTFTQGNIITGADTMIIAAGGSVSRSSGHVVGNLRKQISTNGAVSRTFEVGTGTDYAPIDVAISTVAGSNTNGTQFLTASSTSGDHPSLVPGSGINSLRSVNRYWSLTKGGAWTLSSYSATLNYVNGDIDAGANEGAFAVKKFISPNWVAPPAGSVPDAANNKTNGNGFTSAQGFGDYAVGEIDAAAPTVTINQASGQVDPTTGSPINFTATFNEAVTGFTGSDISFAGSTAGTGGTSAGLSAAVTGGPAVYNVAVTGTATRGNVVATIPASGALDGAGNTSAASTSTDNTVTWDRVPALTLTLAPANPKTNQLLTASGTTSDPDGDNISVAWVWRVIRGSNVCTVQTNSSPSAPAGLRTAALDLSANYVPTSCSGALINPLNPSKGDDVIVDATPNDGLFDGFAPSSLVGIANTTPTVALSGGNNLSPNEGSLYTYSYSISDADGDTIASVATSCGSGTKTNATNTDTTGSFDCSFGDGPASTSVSAQATDSGFGAGAGNNATQSISVQNVAPTIAISGATATSEGALYTLTLGAVSDPGTDTVTSYVVHWGDGNSNTYGTNGVKTHTYADGPASRAITVDLIDEDGTFLDRANAKSVTVDNVAPSIAISGAASVNEGSVYTLTLGAVTDPGQDTVSDYIVHWGDGNTTNYATNGAKTHTYADGDSNHAIIVDLTDEDGTFLDRGDGKSVAVNNVAPSITISGAGSVNEGSSYSLTLGAVTDPGQDSVSSYVVHWGDGNTDSYATNGAKSHTYADGPAMRAITVDLVDEDGTFLDRANAKAVSVDNVAPSIAISGAANVNEGSSYSLTLGAVTDPGTDTVSSYIVHWGDGDSNTYGTNGAKSHTYADGPDDHAITVDLVDEDGTFLDRANALAVHVNNVAPTAHLTGADEVDEGTTHTYTFTVTDPGVDTFTVNTPAYPDCGTGGNYIGGSLSTNLGGGSFQCSFPDGPTTTDVKIRVTDSDGASDTDTENVVVVDVLNVDPVVTLAGPSPVLEGSTYTYSFTTTDDGTPETFSRDAQSCDGGVLSATSFNSVDGSGSFDCTYADGPDSHNPSVTVSDGDGGSDSDSLLVSVSNVAPTIAISGAANVNEGSVYTLTLGAITDPGTDTVSDYIVHWGDGSDDTYATNGREDAHLRRRCR